VVCFELIKDKLINQGKTAMARPLRIPVNNGSNHHSIDESRLESWQNKWEILGIF